VGIEENLASNESGIMIASVAARSYVERFLLSKIEMMQSPEAVVAKKLLLKKSMAD
jgi:hypothetical protein